ncbi:hypothetical protein [Cucumibacter marinus]|uniref:hypothetical protein n=1 Tax=Cucumibacter marinus TaxID=1121252 RepID=UPI00048E9B67|nr:hypothetical protein [Cucumibacter marinus]
MATRVLRQTRDPQAGLEALADEIRDAVLAIDPTVTRVGLLKAIGDDGEFRVTGILLEREGGRHE